jgi:hypothetical protein
MSSNVLLEINPLQSLSVVVFVALTLCRLMDTLFELPGGGLERVRIHTDLDRSVDGLFA